MFTEEEKTELYQKHKGIVYYIANRLRYLDTDFEDILGWGFLGFVVALNKYEEVEKQGQCKENDGNKHIPTLAQLTFTCVRTEILKHYRKRPAESGFISLQKPIGGEGATTTLEGKIADESWFDFSKKNIMELMNKALEKETEINRKITIDFFVAGKTIEGISKETHKSTTYITRTTRRGQAVIKKYLVDHDILEETESYEVEGRIEEASKRIDTYRSVGEDDFRKVKYIRKTYPFLSWNEIASFLQVSPHSLIELLRYPTAKYHSSGSQVDKTIEAEVFEYAKFLYPGHLPGEVVVVQSEDLHEGV